MAQRGLRHLPLLSGKRLHRTEIEYGELLLLLFQLIRNFGATAGACASTAGPSAWRYCPYKHQRPQSSKSWTCGLHDSFVSFQSDLFVMKEIFPVMESDAFGSSRPLSCKEEDVVTPKDINRMFSSITYSKVRRRL